MATATWVAGLYSDLVAQSAPGARPGGLRWAEMEERRVMLATLPPVAEEFYNDLFTYRFWEVRAGLQGIAEFDARQVLLPRAPAAFDEVGWQRAIAGMRAFSLEEERPGRLPSVPAPVPNLGWDDFAWGHDFGARGLGALVVMDEFVNAPLGGGTGGMAPRGRAARLGFSMPAFR